MEIKVGDKVRVSKDAPEMYFFGCSYDNSVCKVILVDRDNAVITQVKNGSFAIPTKYLIKVEDEAKESKFKVGEIVRYRYDGKLYIVECKTSKYYYALRQVGGDIMMHDVLESDLELVTEPKQGIKVGDVIDTPDGKGTVRSSYGDYWVAQLDNGEWYIHMETNMPYAPYTEPTAPTIKIGDFVRVLENLHEPICLDVERHLEITNMPPHAVSQKEWKVISVEMRRDCAGRIYTLKHDDSFIYNIPEDCVELVQPKEQTEKDARIRQMEAELDEFRKAELDRVLHPEKYHTYAVTIDNVAVDWQRYEADLAKDIALKVANKFNTPEQAAEYAVSVAKAVVENLKKK